MIRHFETLQAALDKLSATGFKQIADGRGTSIGARFVKGTVVCQIAKSHGATVSIQYWSTKG